VTDEPLDAAIVMPRDVIVLSRALYAKGDFDLAWLAERPASAAPDATDETTAIALGAAPDASRADVALATRRLKRVADIARATLASEGVKPVPRLDLLAVLEDEIAWARTSGSPFGIVLVHLAGISSARTGQSQAEVDDRLATAAGAIARAVRTVDIVSGRGDDFMVVLPEADERGASVAAGRIATAVISAPLGAGLKPRKARGFAAWSVGRAAFPADGITRDALLAHATATLAPIARSR
jgi:GGDEF domain-containing protein